MNYVDKINVPDIKDINGLWVMDYVSNESIDGVFVPVMNRTRGSVLWGNLTKRCKSGGSYQKDRPSYVGVENKFENNQLFIEWCQDQFGYMHKDETGKFWQLDKDLLVIGNREYSPETCCFVPHRINMILNTSKALRGQWPIGVRKFRNSFTSNYKDVYLGSFKTPEQAHQAWQVAVVENLRAVAQDEQLGETIQNALLKRASIVEEQRKAGIITEYRLDNP